MGLLDTGLALSNPLGMLGLATGLGQDAAERGVGTYETADINPRARDIFQQRFERAQATPEQITQEQMKGIEGTRGALPKLDELQRQNTAMGMATSDDLSQALHARAGRSYDRNLNDMMRQNQFNAPVVKGQRLASAGDALSSGERLAAEAYSRRVQEQTAKQAARNQVLGAVLGASSKFAGAAMGGMGGGGSATAPAPAAASAPAASGYSGYGVGYQGNYGF